MKKLLIAIAILCVVPSVAFCKPLWKLTALNSSTYVAVEIPDAANCGSILWYVSDGSQITIAEDAAGTNERPSAPDTIGEGWDNVCPSYGTKTLFYAKSSSGTPNIIVLFQGK